jgi:transcriptional regulator with XRE-family HTH domain
MLKSLRLLGENLARLLRDKGLSQSELARRAGVSPTYLNQVLSGKNASPKLAHLEKMADVLGVTVSKLFAGPEDRPDPIDALDMVRHLLKELRERGVDSPEIRAMFGHPPKK